MRTVGRLVRPPGGGGTYRLDSHRDRLEAAANWSFYGSVINEAIHTFISAPIVIQVAAEIAEGRFDWNRGTAGNITAFGVNAAFIALQR